MWLYSRIGGRCRIWHKVCRIMAACLGLSILLATLLFSCPDGMRLSPSLDAGYPSPVDTKDGLRIPWRPNRALQFMEVDTSMDGRKIVESERENLYTSQHKVSNLLLNPSPYDSSDTKPPTLIKTIASISNSQNYKNSTPSAAVGPSLYYSRNESNGLEISVLNSPRQSIGSQNWSIVKGYGSDSIRRRYRSRDARVRHTGNSTERPVKRLPKVLIIGVKKAGTRALLEFLRVHPSIESPGPEPHFFDRHYHRGIEWYRELMPRSHHDQLTVEKTPAYFVSAEVPQRVFDLDPNMKLLLVVRDPVTRAISDYCQAASKHSVKPFERMAMVNESLGQVHTNWPAIRIGLYAQHLAQWIRFFPLTQLHVVDGQRLIDQPASELAQVEEFLGIPSFIKDAHFRLRSFKGKFPCLVRQDGSTHCLDERSKGRKHPVVQENVLRLLRQFYRPHNERFFNMIGRTFDWNY